MIPRNLTTYVKNGVTGVTRVTQEQSQAQQGFARNTSGDLPSHGHTGGGMRAEESVTPETSSKTGVTKRCDAERLTRIDSPRCVTPVTPENEHAPAKGDGALIDPESGAPYWLWGPYIDCETLKSWQLDLFEVVDELAKLESWSENDYDHVVVCIERQPRSTLRADLAYFIRRLLAARAEAAARAALDRRTLRLGGFDDRIA